MAGSAATYILAAPYSAHRAWPCSAPGPVHTTEGSPNRRASVISSSVTFLTSSPVCSANTKISAMSSPLRLSDELLRGEELGDLDSAVAFILDGRAGLAWWPLREIDHFGGRTAEPDQGRVDARVGQAHRLDRLLLRRHDPLERRVARFVDLLDHADHGGQGGLDLEVPVFGDPVTAPGRAVAPSLAGQRYP